jgi:hypothetical protein
VRRWKRREKKKVKNNAMTDREDILKGDQA